MIVKTEELVKIPEVDMQYRTSERKPYTQILFLSNKEEEDELNIFKKMSEVYRDYDIDVICTINTPDGIDGPYNVGKLIGVDKSSQEDKIITKITIGYNTSGIVRGALDAVTFYTGEDQYYLDLVCNDLELHEENNTEGE